ncbi:heterokaryon incompatibility protein-domain-containing protein [Phaeosphaeria sp. MPI-PUGE-AT-0046c]|nr:heterokaryon incompatibility protein-domain-containing protein [Phaeosphaeria sp. MPI-PUGE-AT-0046c]
MEFFPGQLVPLPRRLCLRCTTSDFDKLFTTTQDSIGQAECGSCHLGPVSSWAFDSCDFCQFLLRSVQPSHEANAALHDAFKFSSIRLSALLFGVTARSLPHDAIRDNSFVIESRQSDHGRQGTQAMFVLLDDKGHLSRNLTDPMVDFTMLSDWLASTAPLKGFLPQSSRTVWLQSQQPPSRKKSRKLHRSSEATRSRTVSLERARSSVLQLGLNVIDCSQRRLVPLPATEDYVTLSYVWGRPSGQIKRGTPRRPDTILGSQRLAGTRASTPNDPSIAMPSKLPRTIEDSIVVCNALQYRYLWVDRYCIPQEDPHARAAQIQRMDDIYFASALTLIACAGAGPQHGLPGVSRPRPECPTFRLDDSRSLYLIPTVQDIHASAWASRAWTYQEGLLAQRRLFFTDRQVYFESNELIESEFTTRAEAVTRVLDARICSQVTSPNFSGGIHECIEQYSLRNLTYQSDIMNALSGILTYYAREHHIFHFWGIPFSANTPSSINEPPRKRIFTFEESLRWYPRGAQARREGFPSWSWAGWHGNISWHGWRSDLKPASAPFEQGAVQIEVETASGRLLSWDECQARYSEFGESTRHEESNASAEQLSQYIHVRAFMSRISPSEGATRENAELGWDDFRLETVDGSDTLLSHDFGIPLCGTDPTDRDSTSHPQCLLAIHFPGWQDTSEESCASILIVRECGEFWERVALLDDERGILQHAKKTWMKIRLG